MRNEPHTPLSVEHALRQCVTDITRAQIDLSAQRNAETDAEIAYRRAHRRALLSPQCPKVERGGATVATRDAWVEDQSATEWEALRFAQTRSQAAQDHSRSVRDVAQVVQSIGALVRQAFDKAGVS